MTCWTLTAGPRWLVLGVAVAFVIAIQIVLALVAARFVKTQRLILLLVMISGLSLVARFAWILLDSSNGDTLEISRILSTDPLLVVTGIAGLTNTLTASDANLLPLALSNLAHLIALIVALTILSLRFIREPAIENSGYLASVRLTRWLRKPLGHIMPGRRGGQIITEWLRTARASSATVMMVAIAGVIVGLVFRIKMYDGNSGLLILPLIAMVITSEGATDILGNRRGNKLYDIYGVDSKDYLVGFITSIGLLVSTLSLLLIPIFCNGNMDWEMVFSVYCICTAIGFALVGMAVWLNHYCRNLPAHNQLAAQVLQLVSIGLALLPCLLIALILLVVGLYSTILLCIMAALFVVADVHRIKRDMVIQQYWKL